MLPAGLNEILLILILALTILLVGLLVSKLPYLSKVKEEERRKLLALADIKGELERVRSQLREVEALERRLEEVLPALSSLGNEALKAVGRLRSENLPSGVRGEVEAFIGEVEVFKAFRDACLDAAKLWVMEAVRLHLPQTLKRWKEARHGYNPNLDELLGFTLSKQLLAGRKQSLHEWFKEANPSQYGVLEKLLDPSESLQVFFRMLEKTVSEVPYLKVLERKADEIARAERLRRAIEAEKARLEEKARRLEEEMLEAFGKVD